MIDVFISLDEKNEIHDEMRSYGGVGAWNRVEDAGVCSVFA